MPLKTAKTARAKPRTSSRACQCSGPDECAEAMKVLSDPTRLRIVRELIHGPRSVLEIAEAIGQDQPRVSHHLGRMRLAGLLQRERRGRQLIYRINPDIVTANALNFGCCQIAFGPI